MKRTLLLLVTFFCFYISIFAQSRVSNTVKFQNEKLEIYEVFDESRYGDAGWIRCQFLMFDNKTNDEMEVRCSYTIDIVDLSGKGRSRKERKINELIKLKPHERIFIQTVDYRFPDETFFVRFDELINYRVIEKNYEIR